MNGAGHGPSAPLAGNTTEVPLVVDIDGTLIRSDLIIENFFTILANRPIAAIGVWRLPLRSKAWLKDYLADKADLDVATIPLNQPIVDFILQERAKGRAIYLASASNYRLVEALARHLGFIDGVFGSDESVNLSGEAKAERLCHQFGERGFDYIGNDWVDFPVWRRCRIAIATNASRRLVLRLKAERPDAVELPGARTGFKIYLKAMRIHQWLKNLLLFVPLLASHDLTVRSISDSLLAALAYGLAASSAYLLNDLLDLPNDRAHPTKRNRPLASGRLPLAQGALLVPLLLGVATACALVVSTGFLVILALYYLITLAYSLQLKRYMLIDVLTLAGLYTLRILAGSAAAERPSSAWLLGFSVFVFLCLALIKRYVELVGQLKTNKGNPKGRGYRLEDLSILSGLASASGYCSVLVLALYFNSPEVHVLYRNPTLLWLACPPLLYWISRLLLLAHRGELHDDPVVFAATDRSSLITGAIMMAVVLAAV
ncbi:UbiA family prenyltransferase [Nitrospirillum iridis]|uniref:4-hydroxybenzoate polyprenyltransferase/phosphoserine phosphatase n=1 Tax=Nitrospirillum iridis TaxID=765888 RepID=A0A7X0B010_9PROT|nr:UbiA family prenyltransferase [Nitrospirillum iridis]MBB6252872.1 4-hydroxybenzoate polyprenyltransferase/phosphoserine phosphatase [Nitrospirillum iridis]